MTGEVGIAINGWKAYRFCKGVEALGYKWKADTHPKGMIIILLDVPIELKLSVIEACVKIDAEIRQRPNDRI